jgi:hypothetical protein
MGNYTSQYTSGDMTSIIIDGIGAGGVALLGVISLVILVGIFAVAKRYWKKHK